MDKGTLIPLDRSRRRRLLEKTQGYLADMEAFLSDTSAAVTTLLDVLPYTDTALLQKILPLLGYAGKDRVLWPLYHLMKDASKDEQIRITAALQLGLAASISDNPSVLLCKLIKNLDHPESQVRVCCSLALGWEGNWPAVKALMEHLSDPDRDVQAAVITALASVGDHHVFDLLNVRLDFGTMEEQRSILLNLWRFSEQPQAVEETYLKSIQTLPSDLRLDALCGLAQVPLSSAVLECYQQLLLGQDQRIRCQVLENLSSATALTDVGPLKATLRKLLTDDDPRVRQAAVRLIAGWQVSFSD